MKFSIAIPAFKTDFLAQAIESCLNQTYRDFELIVVDDASPNNIKAVTDQYNDSRLHYYRNEKNCGAINVVDNWNICLGHSSGEYIICMGDDDMLAENCLEEYSKLIDLYPGLNVYHAKTDVIDNNGRVIGHQQSRPLLQSCIELILQRWNGDIQFIGDFCYDAKALRKEGGYFKLPLAWGSDDITAVRAAEEKGIANTQVSTFLYRSNNQSITQSRMNGIKLQAKICEKKWYYAFLERNKRSILEHGTIAEKSALNEINRKVFYEYFHGQIELHLNQYFEESLTNLYPALKMHKELSRSISDIIYIWHKKAKKRLGIKL